MYATSFQAIQKNNIYTYIEYSKSKWGREGTVVRTLCSHCPGLWLILRWGTKTPEPKQSDQKKKKKKRQMDQKFKS